MKGGWVPRPPPGTDGVPWYRKKDRMQDGIYDHDFAAGEIERILAPEECVQGVTIPHILVIGVGGVGCRTVDAVHAGTAKSAVTIAIDTDRPKLEPIRADYRILIGRSTLHGFGCAGGFQEKAKEAAERARGTITPLCADADLVVICAGLGWGTGSGAAPVVARYAKEAGALVVAVVTTPMRVRGNTGQVERAEHAFTELKQIADSVILFDVGECLRGQGEMKENLARWDRRRIEMIKEMIVNDIEREQWEWDGFQRIHGQKGTGILMCAETEKEEFVETLILGCMNKPCAFVDPKRGKGAIVRLSSERPITVMDLDYIARSLTYELDPHGLVLYGWHETAGMGERVRVMCLITGIPDAGRPEEGTMDGRPSRRMTSSASGRIDFIE